MPFFLIPVAIVAAKALAAKAAVGAVSHAAVAGVAHAGTAAITHSAMLAAGNVVNAAWATGSIAGAVGVLSAGMKDAHEFAEKVEEYREKHGLDSEGRKIVGHVASENGIEENTVLFLAIAKILEEYLIKLGRRSASGKLHDDLEHLDTCSVCDSCACYGDDGTGRAKCSCGHSDGAHPSYSKNKGIERLMKLYCADGANYSALGHWDESGRVKTSLYEIRGCSMYGCVCADFDRVYKGSNCEKCEHYRHEEIVSSAADREFILIENACKALPRLF